MLRWLLTILIPIAIVFFLLKRQNLSFKDLFKDMDNPVQPHIGYIAPDIDFFDETGRTKKLSEFRGKVVVIHFWGSQWTKELPELEKTYKEFYDQEFAVVPINMDKDKRNVTRIAHDNKLSFQLFFDPELKVTQKYHVYYNGRMPHTIITDKEGKIHMNGQATYLWGKVRKTIRDLLSRPYAEN